MARPPSWLAIPVVAGFITWAAAVSGVHTLARAQAEPMTLTAMDYIEIQQLVAKYATTVVRCTNSGYDYAALYTEDGWFAPTRDGDVGTTWQGRERLAEAAGGGQGGCREVAWQGVTHILANHIITPAPGGATGRVDLIAVGVGGEPSKTEQQGYYEDAYVKTPQGWRFQSRTHHLPPQQP